MAQTIEAGLPIVLDAFFRNAAGESVAPDNPMISIVYPDGSEAVHLDTPTQILNGHYQYTYEVPLGGPFGAWGALWYGSIETFDLDDDDGFTVISPGSSISATTPIATWEDLEIFMLRDFTPAQANNASVTLEYVQGQAEELMNRGIMDSVRTETVLLRPDQSYVPVRYGPVSSIVSVTVGGDEIDSTSYERRDDGIVILGFPGSITLSTPSIAFSAFDECVIQYHGGIVIPRKLQVIKECILGRAARKVQRAIDHSIGATSLSVEGYSAGLMDDKWTDSEREMLLLNRSKARGSGTTRHSPPPVFNGFKPSSGW